MQNFYNSFSFIISFMILVLVFEMTLGQKFVEWFLLLVLASMAVINSDKIGYVFHGITQQGGISGGTTTTGTNGAGRK